MRAIVNQAEHDRWNGDSGRRFVQNADQRDRVMAPVAAALLAAADLTSVGAVVDIGCGCGATTLAAARAVGPDGTATGIDLSGPMLAIARRRATTAGIDNATFLQGDAQTHDLGSERFDVAISHFGSMFFGDPRAAFTNIAAALTPGGRLCLATWQPLVANAWLTVPGAALLGFSSLPDAGPAAGGGMFAQADPGGIRDVLVDAGYHQIRSRPIEIDLRFGADVDEAAAYLADSGPGRAVLATIPEGDRPAALDAVRAELADHTRHDGVHLAAAVLITTAVTPGARDGR